MKKSQKQTHCACLLDKGVGNHAKLSFKRSGSGESQELESLGNDPCLRSDLRAGEPGGPRCSIATRIKRSTPKKRIIKHFLYFDI